MSTIGFEGVGCAGKEGREGGRVAWGVLSSDGDIQKGGGRGRGGRRGLEDGLAESFGREASGGKDISGLVSWSGPLFL